MFVASCVMDCYDLCLSLKCGDFIKGDTACEITHNFQMSVFCRCSSNVCFSKKKKNTHKTETEAQIVSNIVKIVQKLCFDKILWYINIFTLSTAVTINQFVRHGRVITLQSL